jgi:NADH:ubiquinone oxidoreductase subunit 4 (subunit M)
LFLLLLFNSLLFCLVFRDSIWFSIAPEPIIPSLFFIVIIYRSSHHKIRTSPSSHRSSIIGCSLLLLFLCILIMLQCNLLIICSFPFIPFSIKIPSPPLLHWSPEVHREANTSTPPLLAGLSNPFYLFIHLLFWLYSYFLFFIF